MTDHPKPIARYVPALGGMLKHTAGDYIRYTDLAAEREKTRLVTLGAATLQARIAELERKYVEALDFANEEMIKRGDEIKGRVRDNERWRIAIEAKVRELEDHLRGCDYPAGMDARELATYAANKIDAILQGDSHE